jgi:hypothetical protein
VTNIIQKGEFYMIIFLNKLKIVENTPNKNENIIQRGEFYIIIFLNKLKIVENTPPH